MAKTVLILLDDLFFQVNIADAAKRADVAVRFISDAGAFVAQAQQESPAALILDLNYRRSDSLETIRALRGVAALQSVPVIAYVSHVQTELRAAAIEAGCARVLARSAFVQNLPALLTEISA